MKHLITKNNLKTKSFKFLVVVLSFSFFVFSFLNKVQAKELDIDLNWHSSTLVPSWYQGRALPIRGSTITVVAVSSPAQANLTYDWYLDKNYIKYASGLGRDSFSFIATEWPGYEHNVRVKVYNQDQTILSYASVSIDIEEPEVYLDSTEYILKPGQTKTFQAAPYFFTSSNLKYQWFLNNEELKQEKSDIFTLNIAPSSGIGTRKLDVVVSNPNNLLEKARKRAVIEIK